MSLLPAGSTLRIGWKTKLTIGLMTAKARTTPTPIAIADRMMRFRTCSSCSSTENWNRDGRSGSSEPKRPTVTGTATFYLSLTVGGTRHSSDTRERELGDVRCHLNRIVRPRVDLRPQTRRDGVRHEQHPLRVDARHALQHAGMVWPAAEHLGDDRRQIVETRPDALVHEGVEGWRGVVHLAVDQPGDPLGAAGVRRTAERDADVLAEPLLGWQTAAGRTRRVVRRPHRLDGELQDFPVEAAFVAEVVVDRGDVGPRRPTDVSHGDLLEAPVGKQLCRGFQDPLARLAVPLTHGPTYSVLLNSKVAAVMQTAEKATRYNRSNETAPRPVFLSSRFLNACTAYVNGSMAPIHCIHVGKPCCG